MVQQEGQCSEEEGAAGGRLSGPAGPPAEKRRHHVPGQGQQRHHQRHPGVGLRGPAARHDGRGPAGQSGVGARRQQ